MNTETKELSKEPTGLKPLRLLPGVIIVILQWLLRFGIPSVTPNNTALMVGVFSGVLGGLAVAVWWAFFSRAPKLERWVAILLMIAALVTASKYLHPSIATANMGMMFIFFSIPVMSLCFVIWAVVSRNLSTQLRRVTMVITILLASGMWILLRTEGMTSNLHFDFAWRWSKTYEQRFMAKTGIESMTLPAVTKSGADWTGFRGANRDGIVHGLQINTDWKSSPPKELWRRPIGPGCSSVAISGGLLYTQEQRGDDEVVTCYELTSGKPVWVHSDKARFWDSHAGAGPRSTPTLSNGLVYTLGATGILNVLDAGNGSVVWSHDAAKDTEVKIPGWGYASSPLVVDSIVAVSIAGKILAYDLVTRKLLWSGPDGGESYSSPHLMTIDSVRQIVFMNNTSMTSFAPADGKELWKLPLAGGPIVQPARINESDILISDPAATGSIGMSRYTVSNGSDGWEIKKLWSSAGMKPYFNDFVIHKDHTYGFDGLSLACISIADGKRVWRGGRYGGQIILLADQDLLLVQTEKGELALVSATPDKLTELARIPAIKGKTWNHPVLAGDVLVVRNSLEMVAFRLVLATAASGAN